MLQAWFVVDHPLQLVDALYTAQFLRTSGFKVHLLVSLHPYWKQDYLTLCEEFFDSIHVYERLAHEHAQYGIFYLLAVRRLQRSLCSLGIGEKDLIVSFMICWTLENALISLFKQNFKVLVLPEYRFSMDLEVNPDMHLHQFVPGGEISYRMIEPLCGLYRTLYMQEKGTHSAVGTFVRYESAIETLYNVTLLMYNHGQKKAEHLRSGIVATSRPPYQKFYPVEKNNPEKKKIIVFGSGLFSVLTCQLTQTEHEISVLNHCLEYIRRNYQHRYHLIYRPHPIHRQEMECLNLDNFEIELDGAMAELYFLKERAIIHQVFSMTSSTSVIAFNHGLNAYSFLKLFDFLGQEVHNLLELYQGVPSVFFITDLSRLPYPYPPVEIDEQFSIDMAHTLTQYQQYYTHLSHAI